MRPDTIIFDEVEPEVEMKLSKEKPPIYETLVEKFGIRWEDGVVITYGDTAYCFRDLSDDLIVHERVHVVQQLAMGVELWWELYLEDPEFRIEQEVEAYRKQYQFLCATIQDRNKLFSERLRLARDLSSPMYGNIISQNVADRLITQRV